MLEIPVPCNLCKSDNFEEVFRKGKAQVHRIVKCNECGLMYANPQTDNLTGVEEIHANQGEKQDVLIDYTPDKHQYLKKQFLQLKDYSTIINFIKDRTPGVFLEVGSYAGTFLNEVRKRGWRVIGLEPLEVPALYSERVFGIKVIRKYFEEATIAEESIDVVSSCHVIEHVKQPSLFVQKAHTVLKAGGILILETPTYDSLMFKLLKHRERSIRCEGHLFFFTKETMRNLVQANGFRVLKHETVGRTLTLDRLFYNFGIITGFHNFFQKTSKLLALHRVTFSINVKDMQRIYCEKI